VPLILGGVALAGVGVAAAFALSSNSGGSTKKVAAVSLPPLPSTSPGLQTAITGAAQAETGFPGLPTVSLYAVPDEAATLLQGYPGQTGIANTDPASDLPTVDALPSVPVLAFPAEFVQSANIPDVLDGGAF
jgi:hypothetical protein